MGPLKALSTKECWAERDASESAWRRAKATWTRALTVSKRRPRGPTKGDDDETLQYISERLRADKAFVLDVVRGTGMSLEFVAAALRADKDLGR